MIINKSLVLGTCHNSLIDFYISVSFLSLGNFPWFIFYTYKSQYDVICNWELGFLHNDFILHCIRCRLLLISGGGSIGNFNNRVASNFLLYTHDICSACRKLISVMCSLLLASAILFFQTIINLLLQKVIINSTLFEFAMF